MIRWLAAAALALALAVSAAGLAIRARLQPVDPAAGTQVFLVERGSGLARVVRELETAGLVRDGRTVALAARWRGLAQSLRAGEYELSASWPAPEILERIAAGRVMTHSVVVPEGLRASDIAARLERAGLANAQRFLQVAGDEELPRALGIEGPGLEGYLYPETYRFPRGLAEEDIARRFVDQFLQIWREIEPAARARGLSMADTVTLASIVEKETGIAEERPLIASVFHNRLERGMRLETDPTVIYGIENFDGNLTRKHLHDASNPYNTYQIAGLPPGPIANPGREALRAVVEPAESDYLYFVAKGDGSHHFSQSYREHVNAVNRYQKRRRR